MKQKIRKYIKEIIIFVLIVVVASNAISIYRSGDLNKAPLQLSTVTLSDNTQYTIDKSKPILIYFWATWCPVCKVTGPNIQRVSEDFQVLSIATQSGSNQEIKSYLEKHGLNYKVINDHDGSLANHIGINMFPTTIIYDTNQDVIFSDVGYSSTWSLKLKMIWAKF